LGQNDPVRGSFAGLLFGIAFACASIAVCGFLLQRTVFSPESTYDSAHVVLQDESLQRELVRIIATSTVLQLSQGDAAQAATITQNIDIVASTTAGAEILAPVLRDAHSTLIGRADGPVEISGADLVNIVRDERAAVLPPVEIDVPRVGVLAAIDSVIEWVVLGAAIGAIVFLILCLFARPDRSALARTCGAGLIVLSALVLIFGWALPTFVPPLLTDSVWARIPSTLAMHELARMLIATVVLAGVGLGLIALSGRMSRTRRWSTPVSTYRYRDERSWR
jgi:hypothetical protein